MIWSNESSHYNAAGGSAPAYLSGEQKIRWERLRQARMLFEGRHRHYFLTEGRTQFDYPIIRVQDRQIRPYLTVNLLKLISLKTADLLFGAKARIDAPTPEQTDRLDELARRSLLHSRFHEASVRASWAGGAFLVAVLWRGQSYLLNIEPDQIFPVGEIGPEGQYERYVRFATDANMAGLRMLLVSSYEPGRITRRLWALSDKNERGRELSDLSLWPAFADEVPPAEQFLGIPDNLVTYLPNTVDGRIERSDYDGLIEMQDLVNAKFAQVARVLAKHADPKLAAPETAADAEGRLPVQHDVYFFRTKDEIPQYITWSAELQSAMQDRDQAVNSLCMAAEMSQVLLGIKQGAAPDAARKLRLEATNTLSKVGRKALLMEPAIARCIEIAQRLDQTSSLRRSYPVDPIGVEMRDGLPTDPIDDAQEVATLRSAGVMSIEDAVERRKEDPDAAYAEVLRIKAEASANLPSVLMGEPGQEPAAGSGQQAADQQSTINDQQATNNGSGLNAA